MKRTLLVSSVVAAAVVAIPSSAQAEPGILFIPNEDVTLTPSDFCVVPQGGQANSGLGCTNAVAEENTVLTPYSGAEHEAVAEALRNELEPYDVFITTTRPPDYVPFTMLIARGEDLPESIGWACASEGTNCAARKRNGIFFTSGSTMNCMDPDPALSALQAFGRSAGLEGGDPMGAVGTPLAMAYPPDYTAMTLPTSYASECYTLIGINNEMGEPTPLNCTSGDHNGCEAGQQNPAADFMAFFGARTEDTEAPTIAITAPEDGAVFQVGDKFPFTAEVSDNAEQFIAMKWTVTSTALEGVDGTKPGGIVDKCTNNACVVPFEPPYAYPIDGDTSFTEPSFPGAGEYTVTFEASDLHGNVAETQMITVTVEGGATDTGGVDTGDTSAGPTTNGSFTTTAADTGGDTSGSGTTTGEDEDDGGCACTTSPAPGGAGLFLLGLVGLGATRRRR